MSDFGFNTEDRKQTTEANEGGFRTRRRPIGLDYAVAKDAEGGYEESTICNTEPATRNTEHATRNPQLGTRNMHR